jgi:hypothetical protein
MRGIPEHNYPAFLAVEDALESADFTWETDGTCKILNPARNWGGDQTLPTTMYMQADIQHVLNSDVVVLLPGWEKSEGAKLEVRVAQATGKRFVQASESQLLGWIFDPIETPTETPSPRASALDEAKALITGDRNNSYGPPSQDFMRSAEALNAYGYRGPDGRHLQPHDIAIMVMSVKLSRLMWTPGKRDHWVDIAGYAGCGYECTQMEV